MSESPDTGLELGRAGVSGCWNRIGVHGDASCTELQQHIHCRNCPIYSTAAVEVLDAELPSDYRARSTLEIARAKAVTAFDTHSVVVFRLGSEWLARAQGNRERAPDSLAAASTGDPVGACEHPRRIAGVLFLE
jgi:chemotaxis-related protein WspD